MGPPDVPFQRQHELLEQAARRFELPPAPLDDSVRQAALRTARADAAEIFAADDDELDQIIPPLEVLLP